jgi:hypothetical protein
LVPRGFGLGSFHCIKKIPIHPYDKIFMSKEGFAVYPLPDIYFSNQNHTFHFV